MIESDWRTISQKTMKPRVTNMLVTTNTTKGWDAGPEMPEGLLAPKWIEVGTKILQTECDADETAVYFWSR